MRGRLIFSTAIIGFLFFGFTACDPLPSSLPVNDNPYDPQNPESLYNPANLPLCGAVQFVDRDPDENELIGTLTFSPADDESIIEGYRLFWGNSSGEKVSTAFIAEYEKTGGTLSHTFSDDDAASGDSILIFSYSGDEEAAVPQIFDIPDLSLTRLSDINAFDQDATPRYMTVFNDRLYFSANNGTGTSLYEYDPAMPLDWVNANPALRNPKLIDIVAGTDNDLPYSLTVGDNRLFCIAQNASSDRAVYYLTTAGIVSNFFWSMNGLTQLNYLLYWNDDLHLRGYDDDPDFGIELYRDNDQWPTYPVLVYDIYPGGGTNGSWPQFLTVFNNLLVFSAQSSSNNAELWKFDGTNNPSQVGEINASGGANIMDFMEYNGYLYFSANDGTTNHGQELWRWNGTGAPELAADVGRSIPNGSGPGGLTEHQGNLYFQAYPASGSRILYEFDGSTAVEILPDPFPTGFGMVDTVAPASWNGGLYFSAYTADSGQELWVYKDGEMAMVKEMNAGSAHGEPDYLAVLNDRLYFSATDGIWGEELWCLYIK